MPSGAAGEDANAIQRAGRSPGAIAYLMPTGHNPTGRSCRRCAGRPWRPWPNAGRVTVVEDLTLADLVLGGVSAAPPPLAALSTQVIAVGSVSKVLWGGLRVGWIRVSEPLRAAVIARKSALNLGTAVISQALAARLLAAVDTTWLGAHRAALTERRDLLTALLGERLPAWRTRCPTPGCRCGPSSRLITPTRSPSPPPGRASPSWRAPRPVPTAATGTSSGCPSPSSRALWN